MVATIRIRARSTPSRSHGPGRNLPGSLLEEAYKPRALNVTSSSLLGRFCGLFVASGLLGAPLVTKDRLHSAVIVVVLVQVDLSEDGPDVFFHRAFCDRQLRRDACVVEALRHHFQRLALSRGQPFQGPIPVSSE